MFTATWLFVLKPDGLLLSLFGACLFSLALMIRFAPLQLQRVNRESRRCACSPKNYHSATLEAMNSVRNITIMAISTH